MDETEIKEAANAFADAAERAVKAGADGIQVHCAHCYLINQFLSPFFNRRQDKWGGSSENRFRFLKQVIQSIQEKVPDDFCITVKLNTNDFTPKPGITPELAVEYAGMLKNRCLLTLSQVGKSIARYGNSYQEPYQTPVRGCKTASTSGA